RCRSRLEHRRARLGRLGDERRTTRAAVHVRFDARVSRGRDRSADECGDRVLVRTVHAGAWYQPSEGRTKTARHTSSCEQGAHIGQPRCSVLAGCKLVGAASMVFLRSLLDWPGETRMRLRLDHIDAAGLELALPGAR